MDHKELDSSDEGVLTVIIERMNEQRYPRALELKEKVDHGETLDDFDIDFLERVFEDCSSLKTLLDRHPEYQELAGRMMSLYHAITAQALANEQASSS
ncbi:MAG: hypothetical protein QM739_09435 [Propionivibrio sp.]